MIGFTYIARMKPHLFPSFVAALVATAFFAMPAVAKEKEKNPNKRTVTVTLAQCPAAVQTAILGYKGTINELEAEQEGTVVTYDAKITLPDGKRLKLLLAPDGKLLESKEKKAK
jgi:hypothetical protein